MATMLHSESKRSYSWWWDSHISPKNSKWLQDNLSDIDAKVKTMIKLIEEDADSFARRAEMYYEKRPELMKLVEEFYRAYRALAERYDYATSELRHAQRTMAAAFPNQMQLLFPDDSPSGSDRDAQNLDMLHPLRVLLNADFGSADGKKGLEQLQEMLGALENSKTGEEKERNFEGELQLSNESQNLKNFASEEEPEIKSLKKALEDVHTQKAGILHQYEESIEKLSTLERELDGARMSLRGLNEETFNAEAEVQMLKEALLRLEAERDAALLKLNEHKERISELEVALSLAQKDEGGLTGRAVKAEAEAQYLEEELSNLKMKHNAVCREYEQCLEKVSDLEGKLSFTQEKANLLDERAVKAENEARVFNKALAEASKDKEDIIRRYEHCLEKMSKLESELSCARNDIKHLNGALKMKSENLKSVEEKRALLETSNRAFNLEADSLEKQIIIKNEELSKKDEEIKRVQLSLQNEHTNFKQAEDTLQTLRNLHSQALREQKALTLELKNGLKKLKEMEERKNGLEEEIMQVKDENKVLNESNSFSKIARENLESEILKLKEMKGKLENEVRLQMGLTSTLQKEIHSLNEDLESLNTRYRNLIQQIESVGLSPESVESSVKGLQDENSKLRELCDKERDENENFVKKLDNMKQFLDKNVSLESSLSALSGEFEKSQEKVEALQGEKYSLVDEKAVILSQLQAITENMQKLLERNTFLENMLSGANIELSSLREKAKSLEELCKSLNDDKSNLLNETSTLVLQLGNAEKRREDLENRYAELEIKYAGLEKEKESTLTQVEELKTCLNMEKQERAIFTFSSDTRLNRLEDHVQLLQEESRSRKKEFEEELDRAVNAQLEIFVLQRFIHDMEQKNLSLLLECQKHVEASKLSDKVISELESENLEQQVEAELLLDQIKKLRMGIYQVFKTLEVGPDHVDKMEDDKSFFHYVVENIEDMKLSIANYEDDKDQLLIENSVLLTLLGQLKLESSKFELEKNIVQHDFKITCEQLLVAQNEKIEVLEINRELKSDVELRDKQTDKLKDEIKRLSEEQREMKRAFQKLQDAYSQKLEENKSLLKDLLELKEKNNMVEEENHFILVETLALDNKSVVLKHFGDEKAEEVISLSKYLWKLDGLKSDLENEVGKLKSELDIKETENLLLKEWMKKLNVELDEVRDVNSHLKHEFSVGKSFSNQKEVELLVATEKLKAKDEVNSQLCRTMEGLKKENEETVLIIGNLENRYLDLLEENKNQIYEIENLHDFNGSLEFEVSMLREEVEERKIREEILSSELKEISHEFQMWEVEAETFYFDFQISNFRDVFLENKVHELSCVCEMLENERDSRMAEIEQTKERASCLESENGVLKDQLSAYDHVIDSLRDNILSLEKNILSQRELYVAEIHKSEDVELETDRHEKSYKEPMNNDKFPVPNRISELQQLQYRIKEVEKVVSEVMKRRGKLKRSKTNTKLAAAMREIEVLKANYSLCFEKGKQKHKSELRPELSERALQKTKPGLLEMKNGMITTKDIPLDDILNDSLYEVSRRRFQRADDQMIEQCETSEDDHSLGRIKKKLLKQEIQLVNVSRRFENMEKRSVDTSLELQSEKELGVDRLEVPTSGSETALERNKRKILERLNSDAQKLKSVQGTVEDLRRKMEASTIRRKKAKNVDIETVKGQLEEVEDTIIQLVELNVKLTKTVEENAAYSDRKATPELEVIGNLRRKRVADQARKETEKIGLLLAEVQKIQYMLLKLDDEKKSRGKIRFPTSKTSIILRDFISGTRRSSQQRKKPYFACLRTTSPGEDRSVTDFNYLRYE